MNFPHIQTIDDVLPALTGREEFKIKHTPDYTAIDYNYVLPNTFDDPIRRECRGLKFYPDGRIMARPFHKFFNLGEKPETRPEAIDIYQPHVVMEKFDGSMIHPALLLSNQSRESVTFMTRMGLTDVACLAAAYIVKSQPWVIEWCIKMLLDGVTPIMEYTGPDNRIVVAYTEPQLTLLACRQTISGDYLAAVNQREARRAEDGWRGPRASPTGLITNIDRFIAATRALENAEGYVIRFLDTGLMIKLKADAYVLRHKAKDQIGLEKNALRVVLEGADDDMIPLLHETDAAALRRYAADVREVIGQLVVEVEAIVTAGALAERKTFALDYVPRLPPLLKPIAFAGRDGKDVRAELIAHFLKRTSSGPDVAELRKEAGLPTWTEFLSEPS